MLQHHLEADQCDPLLNTQDKNIFRVKQAKINHNYDILLHRILHSFLVFQGIVLGKPGSPRPPRSPVYHTLGSESGKDF